MAVPDSLRRLLTAPGPSGQEDLAAKAWREEAAAFGEVHTDVLGSSWVRVPGTAGGPLLAIVGHIDEIGIVVTHAGDDGLVAIRQVGGYDPHVLLGQRVEVLTRDGRLPGVIGPRRLKRKPGEDRRPIGFDDLFLDIGAKDGAEARSLVRAGDTAVIAGEPVELRGNRIAGRSLDNLRRATAPAWRSSRRRSATSRAHAPRRSSCSPPSRSRST